MESLLSIFTEVSVNGVALWVILLICCGVFMASFMDAIAGGGVEILLTPAEREAFRQAVLPLYERYCGEYMDLVDEIRNG